MELIFIRHGQSQANLERIFGKDDTPLTQEGQAQALEAGKRLVGEGVERIIASPFLRAQETARLINKSLGLEITTDPLVREMSFGDLEGHGFDKARDLYPGGMEAWLEDPLNTPPPGGETILEGRARARAFMEKFDGQEGRVLVVSHEALIRCALTLIVGEASSFFSFRLDNTGLVRIHLGDYKHILFR